MDVGKMGTVIWLSSYRTKGFFMKRLLLIVGLVSSVQGLLLADDVDMQDVAASDSVISSSDGDEMSMNEGAVVGCNANTSLDNAVLLSLAKAAMTNAYAPYSHFQVGAALLGESGRVYTGCNVENASYGATMCAERTAVFKAVSEGERRFVAVAIVSSGGDFTYPCGVCRQVLAEFGLDMAVILENSNGDVRVHTLRELLPHAFTGASLQEVDVENI
jgi:cytidine deaminase